MQGTFNQLDETTKVELWASMALRHTSGLGVRGRSRLRAEFGSAHAALRHSPDWGRLGISRESIQACKSESWREPAKKEWADFKRLGCGILTWQAFPGMLQEIYDPPLFLYYWGNPALLAGPLIAVVGSRRCSRQGLYNAGLLARDLARAGLSVVSGLARGIDREAHLAALSEIGSSIAVLGTGIDLKYPKENSDAFDALAQNGLILSEFPPSTPAAPRNFPVRNRIISGISLGVVVVEAAGRSGSLITARHALEQNRQVYAVPGNPDAESSCGCQELLRKGAVLVRGAGDIIFDLKDQLRMMTLDNSPQSARNPGEASRQIPPEVIPSQNTLRDLSWNIPQKTVTDRKVKTPKSAQTVKAEALSGKKLPLLLTREEKHPSAFDPPANLSPLEAQVISILRANPEGLQIDQIIRLVEDTAESARLTPALLSGSCPDEKQDEKQDKRPGKKPDNEPGENPGKEPSGELADEPADEAERLLRTMPNNGSSGKPGHRPGAAQDPVEHLSPGRGSPAPGYVSGKLAGLLTLLEVAGKVSCKPGLRYVAK